MKKLIIALIMSLSLVHAEEYTLKAMEFFYWNKVAEDLYPISVNIIYNTDTKYKGTYLLIKGSSCTAFFKLKTNKDTLIKGLKKFKEWNIKASKKQVVIKKTILYVPAVFMCVPVVGDVFLDKTNMEMKFVSITPDKHLLVIKTPEMKYNHYSCELNALWLNWDKVCIFLDALNNLETLKAEKNKVEEIKKEFN